MSFHCCYFRCCFDLWLHVAAERVEVHKSLWEVLCDYPVTSFNFFLKCANLSRRLHVVLKGPPKQDLEMKDMKTKIVQLYSNHKSALIGWEDSVSICDGSALPLGTSRYSSLGGIGARAVSDVKAGQFYTGSVWFHYAFPLTEDKDILMSGFLCRKRNLR